VSKNATSQKEQAITVVRKNKLLAGVQSVLRRLCAPLSLLLMLMIPGRTSADAAATAVPVITSMNRRIQKSRGTGPFLFSYSLQIEVAQSWHAHHQLCAVLERIVEVGGSGRGRRVVRDRVPVQRQFDQVVHLEQTANVLQTGNTVVAKKHPLERRQLVQSSNAFDVVSAQIQLSERHQGRQVVHQADAVAYRKLENSVEN